MSKNHKLSLVTVIMSICILSFQNCSKEQPIVLESKNMGSPSFIGAEIPSAINGDSLEAKAITLLQNKCFTCHGPSNSVGISQVNNPAYLISVGQIIPGNPAGSPLYNSVASGSMPIGSAALLASELQLLSDWILAGAKAPSEGSIVVPETIPLAGNFKSIQANILAPKCLFCHSVAKAEDNVYLDSYAKVKKYINGNKPTESKLYEISASGEMPTNNYPDLTAAELKALSDWILAGAPNN